jgi:outer membrane protein, multidrug efflux system
MKSKPRAWMLASIVAAGCTLGPEYKRPAPGIDATWRNAPAATTNAAAAEIGWREFFPDPRLQRLIALALENNRDLRVAGLRVEQTRALYRIQQSAMLPGVGAKAGFARQRTSGTIVDFNGGSIMSTYYVNATVSWELDLFGRLRSLKREALEHFLATEEARRSVQIALVADVAAEYLTQLRLREAKAVANQTLASAQASRDLIRKRFDLGAATELDLRTAEEQVETVRVNAAGFLQQLAESENALANLIGGPAPDDLPAGIPFARQTLLGPVLSGVPSDVLLRRPDILSAEHTLQSANADIGAVRATLFPQILLTGSGGVASAKLGDLFKGPSETWSYGPQVNVPLFDFGGGLARVKASKIEAEIQVATYQKAIQSAFRDVADALAARSILDEKVAAQERLLEAARRRFELTEARYKQGADSYVEVLLAQQDLHAARQNLLQFQVARLLNAVTLYRTLGGGWK